MGKRLLSTNELRKYCDKSRSGMTKDESERIHCKRRFKERFGIDFNRNVKRAIITQIREEDDTLIEKQTNRLSRHRIVYDGHDIDVIYDKFRKNIVTCLYPYLDEQEW